MYNEKTLDLDYNLVKQYFPVAVVVPIILDIYQQLLGVQFEEIKAGTWHPGNQLSFMHSAAAAKSHQMFKSSLSGRKMLQTNLVFLATAILISSLEV
jgi:hypothetical protein